MFLSNYKNKTDIFECEKVPKDHQITYFKKLVCTTTKSPLK